jgi:hypothetical protein
VVKLDAKKTTSRTALNGPGQTSITAPDNPLYGQILRDAVEDDAHRPAVEFVIGCCKVARATNDVMDSLFIKLNKELRRSRLNGWKLWSEFCALHNIKPSQLKTMDNLVTTYADFVVYMAKKGVSEHLKAAARPAVQQLLDMLERNVNLTTNSFIANIVRVNSAKIHKGPR